MSTRTEKPADPLTILAGIKQFGLAPDGSDLRDLEAAIQRLTNESTTPSPVPEASMTPEHKALVERLHELVEFKCSHDMGFDRELGPLGCKLEIDGGCVCAVVIPTMREAAVAIESLSAQGEADAVETMVEKMMHELFGHYDANSNYHAWIDPNWEIARAKIKDALSAALSTQGAVGKWEINHTTGNPILTYEKCSVIQDEQAYYVLGLIRFASNPELTAHFIADKWGGYWQTVKDGKPYNFRLDHASPSETQVAAKLTHALTPEQIADHIGVTPQSDMRPFIVQAVEYTRYQDALIKPEGFSVELLCATENCGKPAAVYFVRDDVGSYYCQSCYLRIQTLTNKEGV